MTEHLSTFQKKLAERRAREMAAVQPTEEVPAEFSDLIPENDTSYERSDDDIAIDRLISGITVDQAYDRWIRKPRPRDRASKREGVMISCPMPNHPDRNPSAWMNLDKNTWYCSGCDMGGDVLDLASIYFGIPDYKTGEDFRRLREAIAEDFGFTRIYAPGLPREGALVAPEPEEDGTPETTSRSVGAGVPPPPTSPVQVVADANSYSDSDSGNGGTVTYLPEGLAAEEGEEDEVLPGLAWRELVTPNTFLDAYMAACIVDDVPEEYHFWHGMLALGLAVGRDVTLFDSQAVLANLFVCTLGPTGIGKSRAASHLVKLLRNALPEEPGNEPSRGAKALSTPGSAEVLIKSFDKQIIGSHPTTGKPIITDHVPVRGLVEYSELSALLGRSGRSGSILKPILMDFFDGKEKVSNASLSHGEQIAVEPFACLLTSTQPEVLKDLLNLGDANSGFLNRWVFVTGIEKKRVSVGGQPVDLTQPIIKLSELWHWADYDVTIGEEPTVIQWSDEALARFDTFFHETIERIKRTGDKDKRAFFQRLDLMMKKIILLLTVNEKLTKVPLSVIDKAIKIFWYLVRVMDIPSQSIGQTAQTELERDILILVKKYEEKNGKEHACPLHYITKIMEKKKVYTKEMIIRALKTLSDLNYLHVEAPAKRSGSGRTAAVRYRLATHE